MKHTAVILPHEEDLFWETGILGTSSPFSLLHSVFYYNGKLFSLRGGEEHRNLSQLKRTEKGFVYTENGLKNRSGGAAQMQVENKVVPSFSVTSNGERCHVYLLDLYIKRVPKEVLEKYYFYCRPKSKAPEGELPWYFVALVGVTDNV